MFVTFSWTMYWILCRSKVMICIFLDADMSRYRKMLSRNKAANLYNDDESYVIDQTKYCLFKSLPICCYSECETCLAELWHSHPWHDQSTHLEHKLDLSWWKQRNACKGTQSRVSIILCASMPLTSAQLLSKVQCSCQTLLFDALGFSFTVNASFLTIRTKERLLNYTSNISCTIIWLFIMRFTIFWN